MKNLARLTLVMTLLWVSLLVQADPDAAAKYQSCAVCHGEIGQGNVELGAPALAGQRAQYLERQLQYFKSGVRGADPRDTQGLSRWSSARQFWLEYTSPVYAERHLPKAAVPELSAGLAGHTSRR